MFVMSVDIVTVFGMQIGLKNRISRSSCSRMMPHDSSLDVVSTVMPHLRMQPVFFSKRFKHMVFLNKS